LTDAQEAALGTRPDASDSDGDGLPDGWEAKHALDPLSGAGDAGAEGDPDDDGLSNAGELAAGTNPQHAASTLRLGTRSLSGGVFEFTWDSVPARRYHLQVADAPQLEFRDLTAPGLPLTAAGASAAFRLPAGVPVAGPQFFRLRLVP
jgi:hypothetical protein